MKMDKYLLPFPFGNKHKWGKSDKPILILDDSFHRIQEIDNDLDGVAAYIIGLNEKYADRVGNHLSAEYIQFYEMRIADLSFLKSIDKLLHLAIRWNTKINDVSFVLNHKDLQSLVLNDTPKIIDLDPISSLNKLKIFEYSGGIWNKNTVRSLEPVTKCNSLEFLDLTHIKILEDGLRPLANMKSLKKLRLSNAYPTEEFAYLSVHLAGTDCNLPNTDCSLFHPYNILKRPIEDKDVMITGSRKPLLNSEKDKAKIEKYAREFEKMREKFIDQSKG